MNQTMEQLLNAYERQIYGQRTNLKLFLTAILAGGHVLLEGVPGIGKTKMVRTLADLIGGEFNRIQFTPDLMPSDITGNAVYNMKEGRFDTLKGPIFTNLLLADEVNRTPAKTQAALLEAMEEHQVTIQGKTYRLPEPFYVIATQNPIEYEGTDPLPEAQQDRFLFKLLIEYPNLEAEKQVLRQMLKTSDAPNEQGEMVAGSRAVFPVVSLEEWKQLQMQVRTVNVEEAIIDYIAQIVRKTRESSFVRLGASPRAGISVLLASQAWAFMEGRDYVTPDDVKMVVRPAMRHRIVATPQIELEGGTSDQIIQDVVASTPVPR
jgi:MoxR-like ATPase